MPRTAFEMIPDRLLAHARHSAALLRLAALLHRARGDAMPPGLQLRADGETLTLRVDASWLQSHPLLRADLDTECEDMPGLGVHLNLLVD